MGRIIPIIVRTEIVSRGSSRKGVENAKRHNKSRVRICYNYTYDNMINTRTAETTPQSSILPYVNYNTGEFDNYVRSIFALGIVSTVELNELRAFLLFTSDRRAEKASILGESNSENVFNYCHAYTNSLNAYCLAHFVLKAERLSQPSIQHGGIWFCPQLTCLKRL